MAFRNSAPLKKGAIPDLLQPELLTFSSDRGLMVCGFEEIDGRGYYQGWWMQWGAAITRHKFTAHQGCNTVATPKLLGQYFLPTDLLLEGV